MVVCFLFGWLVLGGFFFFLVWFLQEKKFSITVLLG